MLDLAEAFLKPGGHRSLFWSTLQFAELAPNLKQSKETLSVPSVEGWLHRREKRKFQLWKEGHHLCSRTKPFYPASLKEDWASHRHDWVWNLFWRACLCFKEMLKSLDYHTRTPNLSGNPSNPNLLTGIPGCRLLKQVFDPDKPVGGSGRHPMLGPE